MLYNPNVGGLIGGTGQRLPVPCVSCQDSRYLSLQGHPQIDSLDVSRNIASKDEPVFITAEYECKSAGLFTQGCDMHAQIYVTGQSGRQYAVWNNPPTGVQEVSVDTKQHMNVEFRMPNERVVVTMVLYRITDGVEQQSGGTATRTVELARDIGEATIGDFGRGFNLGVTQAINQTATTLLPYLPVIIIGGVLIVGAVLLLPHISKLVEALPTPGVKIVKAQSAPSAPPVTT